MFLSEQPSNILYSTRMDVFTWLLECQPLFECVCGWAGGWGWDRHCRKGKSKNYSKWHLLQVHEGLPLVDIRCKGRLNWSTLICHCYKLSQCRLDIFVFHSIKPFNSTFLCKTCGAGSLLMAIWARIIDCSFKQKVGQQIFHVIPQLKDWWEYSPSGSFTCPSLLSSNLPPSHSTFRIPHTGLRQGMVKGKNLIQGCKTQHSVPVFNSIHVGK